MTAILLLFCDNHHLKIKLFRPLLCHDSSSTCASWMSIISGEQISSLAVHVYKAVLPFWSSRWHLQTVCCKPTVKSTNIKIKPFDYHFHFRYLILSTPFSTELVRHKTDSKKITAVLTNAGWGFWRNKRVIHSLIHFSATSFCFYTSSSFIGIKKEISHQCYSWMNNCISIPDNSSTPIQ